MNTLMNINLKPIKNEPVIKNVHKITIQRRKEGNVLINKALNTFYLQLFCIRHVVKDR